MRVHSRASAGPWKEKFKGVWSKGTLAKQDVVLLKLVGMNPVVVHGGGPQIEAALGRLGKKGEFIQGMRVTDEETLDVVEMVLGGLINQEIVTLINKAGGKAVGLTGKDGHFIHARKLKVASKENKKKKIDVGLVGEVVRIDPEIIHLLDSRDFIPVLCDNGCLAAEECDFSLNTLQSAQGNEGTGSILGQRRGAQETEQGNHHREHQGVDHRLPVEGTQCIHHVIESDRRTARSGVTQSRRRIDRACVGGP